MQKNKVTQPAEKFPEPQTFAEMHSPRILLAEDDDEMRRFLADILRKDGYNVIEVKTGFELLFMIEKEILNPKDSLGIDLIISDIRMPGTSGLSVLARIRQLDGLLPVLLITAFGDEETHREAKRLGAFSVLNKPFDLDDFRTAVYYLVEPPKPVFSGN